MLVVFEVVDDGKEASLMLGLRSKMKSSLNKNKMIQNNSLSSQTKFDKNQINKAQQANDASMSI